MARVPLAVTVVDFSAERGGPGVVRLAWSTEAEPDLAGFNLYRAAAGSSVRTRLNARLVPARGGPVTGVSYEYLDRPGNGVYNYWLEDVGWNGATALHGPVAATVSQAFLPLVGR
jgi:hypothetical protein